jgi:hypothetical protein
MGVGAGRIPEGLAHGLEIMFSDEIKSTENHCDETERNNHLTEHRPELMQDQETESDKEQEGTHEGPKKTVHDGPRVGRKSKFLAKCLTLKYCFLYPKTVLHSNQFIATVLTFLAIAV